MSSLARISRTAALAALSAATLALLPSPASAQPCDPAWQPGFGLPGIDGVLSAGAVFDDGTGPTLYVAGGFTVAGGVVANHIAKWVGGAWVPLGDGLQSSAASPVDVREMIVFDDGAGPALYVAGEFDRAGGQPAGCIASWNGTTWSTLAGGVRHNGNPHVNALLVHDDGSGPALLVAGLFNGAGPLTVQNTARWRGPGQGNQGWSAAGAAPIAFNDLAVFDDHSPIGATVYACVGAGTTGPQSPPLQTLYYWNVNQWDPVPGALATGAAGDIGGYALATYDWGQGPELYIGGRFATLGGAACGAVARWDGAQFRSVGAGFDPAGSTIVQLLVADAGHGPNLLARGTLIEAFPGAPDGRVVRWDGALWINADNGLGASLGALVDGSEYPPYGGGLYAVGSDPTHFAFASLLRFSADHWDPLPLTDSGDGLSRPVRSLVKWNDGSGESLYLGGDRGSLGGNSSPLLRWTGSGWSGVIPVLSNDIYTMLPVHDASGSALILAGNILFSPAGLQNVGRWNGSGISAMGHQTDPGRFNDGVIALASKGTGAALELVASGWYTTQVPYHPFEGRVARWTGQWTPLGPIFDLPPVALAYYNNALYAGGNFQHLNQAVFNFLGRWDGQQWQTFAALNGQVTALATFDDGSGEALYVSGAFTRINNIPFNRIARYRNGAWENLGGFFSGARTLAIADTAHGPRLHAAGNLLVVQGPLASNLAEWDGAQWHALGATTDAAILAFASLEDPATGRISLFAGGDFTHAGDLVMSHIARFDPCALTCPGDANHNGVIDFVDLNILLDHYGQTSPPGTFDPADFNLDGVVDFLDLNELLSSYGGVCNS